MTQAERDNESSPKPSVTIVDYGTGETTQATLGQLNQQMVSFHKVILLIEDTASDSNTCAKALHELGYDGVQLITNLTAAEQHLDTESLVSRRLRPPSFLTLGLARIADLQSCVSAMPSRGCKKFLSWFGRSIQTLCPGHSAII